MPLSLLKKFWDRFLAAPVSTYRIAHFDSGMQDTKSYCMSRQPSRYRIPWIAFGVAMRVWYGIIRARNEK